MSIIFPFLDNWNEKYDTNPVGSLMELAKARNWDLSFSPVKEIGPVHCRLFSTATVINGWKFRDVKDKHKKQAKKLACHLTLRVIYVRTRCIMQDKVPEEEIEFARTVSLTPEDLHVEQIGLQQFVHASDDLAGSTFQDFSKKLDENVDVIMSEGPPSAKVQKMEADANANPITLLNQYAQKNNLRLTFEQVESKIVSNRPQHSVRLMLGEKTLPSITAHSKKAAKYNAAVMALHTLVSAGQFSAEIADLKPIDPPPSPPRPRKEPKKRKRVLPASANGEGDTSEGQIKVPNRNPITILHEYAQVHTKELTFLTLNTDGPAHSRRFEMAVQLGDRVFDKVTAMNKHTGRNKAAEVALQEILKEGEVIPSMNTGYVELEITDQMTFFDRIAAVSHRAVNCILGQIKPIVGRKVISTIIMKTSDNDLGTVICLGLGNWVVRGENLSQSGETLNDSHAEVIVRRSFVRYLYNQLMQFVSSGQGIFEQSSSGKLRVQDQYTFHMYSSTAPCGDASLFSPKSAGTEELYGQSDPMPLYLNSAHGQLRTKMEGGEGTRPLDPEKVYQSWDGIQLGEKLRTMSCSDKMCRWNVVGLQGALLSHFLDPVYLSSLTLGQMYHAGHLSRAISMRLNREFNEPLQDQLPTNFYHKMPNIGQITACKPPREPFRPNYLSVNWSYGDTVPELTEGKTGRLAVEAMDTTPQPPTPQSRLSKAALFGEFKKLCELLQRRDLLGKTYHVSKMEAIEYQTGKEAVTKRLATNNFGKWLTKPVEEELFQ